MSVWKRLLQLKRVRDLVIVFQSFLAGVATLLGVILVLLFKKPGNRLLSFLLGLSSGIMLGVIVSDLIPSALSTGNFLTMAGGVLLGVVVLSIMDDILSRAIPVRRKANQRLASMGYLIATGIAMHDLPEGMSIAVGYAAADELGLIITIAIALHNIPEGMATAAPLFMAGISIKRILLLAVAMSLITPLGTILGLTIVGISRTVISPLLSLAAGAMAYIVFLEILPEAWRRRPFWGVMGIMAGALLIVTVGSF